MCSHLHDLVLQAEADDFWLWIVVALVLGLIAIYSGFRTLICARIIENTPTSKIRSAA